MITISIAWYFKQHHIKYIHETGVCMFLGSFLILSANRMEQPTCISSHTGALIGLVARATQSSITTPFESLACNTTLLASQGSTVFDNVRFPPLTLSREHSTMLFCRLDGVQFRCILQLLAPSCHIHSGYHSESSKLGLQFCIFQQHHH